MSDGKPTVWQINISHYGEKVRWALDHKRIPHRRRSPLPGMHIPIVLWLTRGGSVTLPAIKLEGRTIADSTAILAAIEERYPDPPLYPADPELRRRALELEEFFDEELGPDVRLLVFHEMGREPELFAEVAARAVPGPLGRAQGFVGAYARGYTGLRFGVKSEAAADAARTKIRAALDRLDAELAANGGEFLVGDSLGVADLTAASLFYPLVGPENAPTPADQPVPAGLARFREELAERPGYIWVEEMFRRHRKPTAPVAVGAGL
jgi:glutathione S-transferase